MKLSDKQKRIISSVQLQANATIAQIAEETGYGPYVVQRAIDFLKEQKILFPYICIDPQPLGLGYHGAYFSYLCDSEDERQKLLEHIQTTPQVSVAREFAGEYQFGARLLVAKVEEVDRFLGSLGKVCQGHFMNKVIATWVKWSRYRHKFFSDHPSAVSSINFGQNSSSQKEVAIDETDLSILRHLANSALLPAAKLARVLKLPNSTVDYRIKRLEEMGVIRGYGYTVSGSKCGLHASHLLIWLKQLNDGFDDEIFRFAESHPNIKFLAHCVGNWDYEIGLRTDNAKDVPAIVQSIYSRYQEQIGMLKLLPIMGRVKMSTFPL